MAVRVAGIGIAVCDPKDNVLFEKMSPLESMVDGKETSSECAELEALVEGLNIALVLGLENVTFFCADYMLYQYVSCYNFSSIPHFYVYILFYG